MAIAPKRRRDRGARIADTLFGYLIPLFFVVLAGYQQVTIGAVDKYVIAALLVFGLGALGWRVDVLFDGYMRARYGDQKGPEDRHEQTEKIEDNDGTR